MASQRPGLARRNAGGNVRALTARQRSRAIIAHLTYEDVKCKAPQVDINPKLTMQSCDRSKNKPERIASINVAAKRLGVSRTTLEKLVRRGMIQPDFTSDLGTYFRPEHLTAIKTVINQNRALRRKHCSAVSSI